MVLDKNSDMEICTLTQLTLTSVDIRQLSDLYSNFGYGILEHILTLASEVSEKDCFDLSITDLIEGEPL